MNVTKFRLKKRLNLATLCVANLLCAHSAFAVSAPKALISPAELQTLISSDKAKFERNYVLLDTRGRYKDYIKGHVPGARHMNFDTLRGTDANGVPVQYLATELTQTILGNVGITRDKNVIVYADGTGDDILSPSMVAYVLEKNGVQNVQIVNGGLMDYAAQYETTKKYPKTPQAKMTAKVQKDMGIDVQTLTKLNGQGKIALIDARPENEYLGKDDIWPRQGHIPGAVNIPWSTAVHKENTHRFRDWSEVESVFTKAGITPDQNVVVYCGTSREGSLLRFYLTHVAGYKNVRLYEGSWKEYSAIDQLPIETAANTTVKLKAN